jgi:hypothetical protein
MSASNSRRRREAAERASYTGEENPLAARAVGRGPAFGLDACEEGQRRLRALFALYVINHGRTAAGPGSASVVLSYTPVISPQFHELRLVTDSPHNVMGRLLGGASGLPGLRVAGMTPAASPFHADTLELLHLPTQARMAITRQTRRADPATVDACEVAHAARYFDEWTHDVALTAAEQEQLADWPAMSTDIERLFAGLTSRLGLKDPAKKWGLGQWYWDPCEGRERLTELGADGRRLWGAGDHWQLTWDGYPFIDDLVEAVTHPAVGIPEARASWQAPNARAELALGTARLLLTHKPRYADGPPFGRRRQGQGA